MADVRLHRSSQADRVEDRNVKRIQSRRPPCGSSGWQTTAANDFAKQTQGSGERLDEGWLNNGPSSLTRLLPAGWELRLQSAFRGEAISLDCLGREDLLKTKLFALCDRGIDLGDCIALSPSEAELKTAEPWVATQDLNPDWPAHVASTLADLAKRLARGI